MARAWVVLVGVAAVVPAVWLGLHVRQNIQCSALKEDVLNSISAMNNATAIQTLAQDRPSLVEAARRIQRNAERDSEAAMLAMIGKCGNRAVETAVREASESMLR